MAKDAVFEKGTKYEILVGIKDQDLYQEVIDEDDFKDMLVEICSDMEIGFSLLTQLGGYAHGKGYTTETSLRVILVGVSEDEVVQLAERLKQAVNTDAVLVTKTEVETCFR